MANRKTNTKKTTKSKTKSNTKSAARTKTRAKTQVKAKAQKPRKVTRKKKSSKLKTVLVIIAAVVVVGIIALVIVLAQPKSYIIGGRTYTKLEDYLYEVTYTDYDSTEAEQLYQTKFPPVTTGACSSVRNGDFHGRSYDWYYDESAEFVIHMPATETRHASVSIAGSMPDLSNDFVQTAEYSNRYEMLPLIAVDGINDAGFAINVNILMSNDTGRTTGTNPGKHNLLINNVVRYLLDNAGSVDEAIDILNNSNVYVSAANPKINYEFHFMLSDPDKTVVVEFLDNQLVVVEDANIMTNFYLSLPVNEYSMGTERYALLEQNYAEGSTKLGMYNLMQRVKYTNSYDRSTNPFWYSEYYNAKTGINKNSPAAELEAAVDEMIAKYNTHQRDGSSWQTVHFSVYDLKNKTLMLSAQENGYVFEFNI